MGYVFILSYIQRRHYRIAGAFPLRWIVGVSESVGLKETTMSIWTILFVILLIAWIGGFTVFHVTGGLIHLLLIFAVISLVLHFVMGRRTV